MVITWFCIWQGTTLATLDECDRARLFSVTTAVPSVRRVHLMTPTQIDDPFFKDRSGTPSLVLQLDFRSVQPLEAALAHNGRLAQLLDPGLLPSLAGQNLSHQAMAGRRYPVIRGPRRKSAVYWVEYTPDSFDSRAWLYQYAATHPQILTRFPAIRLVELYTPVDIICGLQLPLRPCIQRNKTVWDNIAAMNRAMASPIRTELREDMAQLPPFDGSQLHFPFACESVGGKAP